MKLNKKFFLRLILNAVFFTLPIGLWYGWETVNYGGILFHFPRNVWLSVILAIPLLAQLLGLIISFIDDRFRPFVYGSLIPILYSSGITLYNLGMNFYYKMYKVAPYAKDSMPVKWIKLKKMGDVIMQFDVLTFTVACVGLTLTRLMVVAMWKKLNKHDLLKGSNDKKLEEGPWQAGFMEKSKIKVLASNSTGLPLGTLPGKWGKKEGIIRFKENAKKGWLGGHHVVIAGSRGGKGVSCVLPALLDHQGPVCVIDIKGELFSTTRKYRETLGRKVVVLNPFDVIEENRISWNPLDYIRPEFFDRDVSTICDGLIKPELSFNPHFNDMAKDLLRAGIQYLQENQPEKFNLIELYELFFKNGMIETLENWKNSPHLCHGRLTEIAYTVLQAGNDERGSFITTLKRSLSWIKFEQCQKFLQTSDFNMDDLLRNKLDVFCVVPLDMLKEMERFFRLFTNIVLGTVIRETTEKKAEKPILLMLDEFPRIGKLENMMSMITVGAGHGLELFMVAQDRTSIESVWNKETETIIGNAATTRVFNLGRGDSRTAPWVASLMGDKTIVTQSQSSSENEKSQNQGESFNQTKDKLLNSVDVLEMGHDEMLCFIRSQKPLKLNRIISHKHRAYKYKLDKNPLLRKT